MCALCISAFAGFSSICLWRSLADALACVRLQFGVFVLTTSAGIMDHEEARRKKVGGKVRPIRALLLW